MRRYTSAARAPRGVVGRHIGRRVLPADGVVGGGPRTSVHATWPGARARDVPRWLGVRSVERAGPRHPPGGGTAGRVV